MAPVYGVVKFSLMIFLEIRLQTVQETSGFGFWIEPKYLNRNIGQPNFYLYYNIQIETLVSILLSVVKFE